MKRILFAVFMSVLLLTACSSKAETPAITDPSQPIAVNAGETFTIVIESNPTTGYHWDIVGELDSNTLEFISNEYTSTSDPNLAGGGGLDVWTFKAVNTGETQITLGYYPPSNDPVDPDQTVTFTVTIK